jgi:hypothetical protein
MLLISFLNSEGLEFVIIIFVSLANKIGLDISDIIFGRTLMCKKKSGLSIEPCETPYLIGSHLEKYLMELFFNKTL